MSGARRRIKRASSLSCCSLDSEYFSSYGTEFSDFSSRISERERYSPLLNTVEALETQISTETNELEALSELHVKLKNNEERAMSKTSDLRALIEERVKRYRNEASKQKKEFTDKINVMQQNLESVCNKNADLESQLENEREKVSQYLIRIKNLEENLAETVSTKENLLKEKDNELECQCSKEKDLEEQLRDAMWEINALHKKKSEFKLQNEESRKEYSETIKKLTETIDLTYQENKHFKTNTQLIERKMEELAEGVRQKMEDSIRILHRRVHVTELLNNENKDSYKSTKEKFEEESKMFREKIADYENEITTLREKVLKLEGDRSEEGEKMKLMKTVTQLESKTMKLEKKVKEKDDELVSLGENKKEAIRQLCFLTEFHRDRCLIMKDLMLTMRIKNQI